MSLIRTALRLQAIEALNADPAIDALVQGRVYDSRIAAFDHREPMPTILVTTEETKGEAWSHQNGGEPFALTCDLVLELAMNAVARVTLEGGESVDAIGYAATDRKLEALLDLLEDRAIHVLTAGETPAAQLLRAAVVKRVPRVASSRFATDQTGEKFAVHLVTLSVALFTPEPDDPFAGPGGDFGALPEPLRTVAEASDPEGSVRATCQLLAARLAPVAPPTTASPFAGADLVLAPQSLEPSLPPDRASDLGAGRTVAVSADIPLS